MPLTIVRSSSAGCKRPLSARHLLLGLVGVVLLAASGCSSGQAAEVSTAARGFFAALAERDGDAACALLSADTRDELEQSAGKPCPDAILEEDLPQEATLGEPSVYDTMAFVAVGAGAMFLGRFPHEGWLVTGVGCELTGPADRYDCTVAGS